MNLFLVFKKYFNPLLGSFNYQKSDKYKLVIWKQCGRISSTVYAIQIKNFISTDKGVFKKLMKYSKI